MRTLVLSLLLAGLQAFAAPRQHAYAPPVIPHALEAGAACTACHGKAISGGVPAIPHRAGGDCRSCHVAQQAARPFRPNAFKGEPALRGRGPRAYPGAPPSLPHPVFMRENCQACHGREAHPGMRRNPHPERADCLSCHLQG